MPRVLIITGDAGEALEVYYPLQRFQEEGWQVDVAAPSRKRIQLVVHDFEPLMETYTEKLGYGLKVQMSFADVRADDYDGLVIPGGRAPEYIRNVPGCVELIADFNRQGKPIAAICLPSTLALRMTARVALTVAAGPDTGPASAATE